MSKDKPKPVSVRMKQNWHCESCRAEGHFTHWSDNDSLTVKQGALRQHARLSPHCVNTWLRFGDRTDQREL